MLGFFWILSLWEQSWLLESLDLMFFLEKAMTPHSSTLAWKTPWKAAVHGVGCSPWGHEEPDTTERLHFHLSLSHIGEGNGNPLQCSHSSVLALRIPGTGEPGGLPSMGSHRVGHDWSDLAAAAATFFQFNNSKRKWRLFWTWPAKFYEFLLAQAELCSMLSHFSHARLFAMPWTIPGSSVHGILWARILECVAISSSRGSSPPGGRTYVSYVFCIGRQVLYH